MEDEARVRAGKLAGGHGENLQPQFTLGSTDALTTEVQNGLIARGLPSKEALECDSTALLPNPHPLPLPDSVSAAVRAMPCHAMPRLREP